MQSLKVYPQTPIDYADWNAVIEALDVRFGSSTADFIRDRTRIMNKMGNIWEKVIGNMKPTKTGTVYVGPIQKVCMRV